MPLVFVALLTAIAVMQVSALAARAATDSGVYVDIRASESSDAPVTERWKLYGASHALIIGIDLYRNGWPRLSNAVKDAERVAAALEAQGYEVELLKNVDGETLRDKLREFYVLKGADPDARLLVWFSGHGHTESSEGYLVPADAPLPSDRSFRLSALPMRDFGSLVRLAEAKHALAVFDSCFAGTIFSSQRARPPAQITRATVKPVRQFITSGDADQQVSDDGTFSRLFIDAIASNSSADLNSDGYVTASELGLHLETRMTNLSEGVQTPRSGKLRDPSLDGGDFVLAIPVALPDQADSQGTAAPAPDSGIYDLEFWNAVKDSSDPAAFQAYLETYPRGRFAALARLRLKQMNEAAGPSAELAAPQPAPKAAEPAPQASAASSDAEQGTQTASLHPAEKMEFERIMRDRRSEATLNFFNFVKTGGLGERILDRNPTGAIIYGYEYLNQQGDDVVAMIHFELTSTINRHLFGSYKRRFLINLDGDRIVFKSDLGALD